MSTFKEIISRVDECRPNAFSRAVKFRWLTQLEGKIAADVFLMNITEIRALPRKYPDDMDRETLVDFPHDDLYDAWLEAKIDAENGEYNKYQNSMELYNEYYGNFVRWFASVYEPAQGGQTGCFCIRSDVPTYYITAYGLAVKQGYRGTVEEWLASLVGPKGDAGKSAYQYAQEAGYTGTEEQFRESQLNNGKTAYEYAVEGGYQGTAEEFRAKLAADAKAEFALKNHNHDDMYAPKEHNHDDAYAPKEHNHDDAYAPKDHSHDETYAPKDHSHDETYAPKEHNHEDTYAPKDHSHTAEDVGALPSTGGVLTGALTLQDVLTLQGLLIVGSDVCFDALPDVSEVEPVKGRLILVKA